MSYQKIAHLVVLLSRKTKEGKLAWSATERNGVFQVSFPSHSVRIFEKLVPHDEGGQRLDMVAQIIDYNGDVVEEVSDEDLKGMVAGPYTTMRDMFETARRQAMGVESAIDGIIDELTSHD